MTEPLDFTADAEIDVRGTKCPLNFVKARLALEKLPVGGVLAIWVDAGSQSELNIPQSMAASGHSVLGQSTDEPGTLRLWVRRGA